MLFFLILKNFKLNKKIKLYGNELKKYYKLKNILKKI